MPGSRERWSSTLWLANSMRGYRKLSTASGSSSQHDEEDVEIVDDKLHTPTRYRTLTRRSIGCLLCTLLMTMLTATALFYVLRRIFVPSLPSYAITLGRGVERSKCCSERLAYVPTDDVLPIHAHSIFKDSEVVEQWIAFGRIQKEIDLSSHVRIDAVTTWVNGSDVRHVANRLKYGLNPKIISSPAGTYNKEAESYSSNASSLVKDPHALNVALQNSDNRYREFDELRYSVRSTRHSLRRHLGTHHIVSTDFWKENAPSKGIVDFVSGNRRGQVPQWLDQRSPLVAFGEKEKTAVPAVRMHHDWDLFVPLDRNADTEQWRAQRLPTFSSLAVEAMIGLNMPGLAQTYILGSDDMFLSGNSTTADFFTPLFGTVVRFNMDSFYNGWTGAFRGHETTGFHYDATLLKKRFGTPGIPYPSHVNKPNVQPITVEARTIWRDEFELATSRRFRGDGWTINSHSLTFAMQMERHREALLWSYLVAKSDVDGDGILNAAELKSTLAEMGAENISSSVEVLLPRRTSNNERYRDQLLNATGFPLAGSTKHTFSSFDGYPFLTPERSFIRATGLSYRLSPFSLDDQDVEANKRFGNRRFETAVCRIDLLSCWPRDKRGQADFRTTEVFSAFAFQNRRCGDCLITQLVGRSGRQGLNAFLPPRDLAFPNEALQAARSSTSRDETTVAYHLPLSNSWAEIDFSLTAVAIQNGLGKDSSSPWSLPSRRTFAAHLLARYTYSLGTSTTKLEMLNRPKHIAVKLRRLRQLVSRLAFFCINDDLEMDGIPASVKDSYQGFLESIWPTNKFRMPFEKPEFNFSQMEENAYPYSNI